MSSESGRHDEAGLSGAFIRQQRPGLPASLFHTDNLDPAQRFSAWRESVGVFLESSLLAGDAGENFSGRVESYLLDDLMLSRPRAGRQKFDRPERKISGDSIDHYMI